MPTANDIQRDTGNATEAISAQDPLTILSGIEQFGLAADGSDLRDLREALSRTGAVKVKPLDLSNLLRHAFFEGVMIAGGSQETAAELWPEYNPETCAAYSRILSALEPASPEAQQELVACATEGCDNPATNEFIRGGIGSMYCGECFAKVVEVCGHGIPDYFGRLVDRARDAAAKASTKFPQPNYVTLKIAEEAGEVVRGAVHYAEGRMEWSEVEGEIVQLIAMLIRFVTEGDQINGVNPPPQPDESADQTGAHAVGEDGQESQQEPVAYPKIMYCCEYCSEHNPEMCGYDRRDIYVTNDGRWLCDGCREEEGISSRECSSPPFLYTRPTE